VYPRLDRIVRKARKLVEQKYTYEAGLKDIEGYAELWENKANKIWQR